MLSSSFVERDAAVLWHPFTQHQTTVAPLLIERAEGLYLIDEQGKRYMDLISSWWVNLHGHGNPKIAEAIYHQASTLEHVIFSGFTHKPAILLAEELLRLAGDNFSKVFYSDNGSTAVEVALKLAYQYWWNQGEKQRNRFIAFKKGYHGDTFGAMAIGKSSGFFTAFRDLLFDVQLFPYPETWHADEKYQAKEDAILAELERELAQWGNQTAALIIEPLIQGAAGMKMCHPQFLQKLEKLVKSYNVLLIYDEVMTGFGRTGDLFACHKSNTSPDIICLAKGLTGGFLPLSATLCRERIYRAFLGPHFNKAFAHGHSYMANPLGCAAGLVSLQILTSEQTRAQIKMIETTHKESLEAFSSCDYIEKIRFCGTIAAFDLLIELDYSSTKSLQLRELFLNKGLLIRPLGNVIYLMPPYCISASELKEAYAIIQQELQGFIA